MKMATPITGDQLISQLKKWKVPYREIEGWRTRGRDDETGLRFGPVFGCGTHHTGSDSPDTANRDLIIRGRSGLPGPLAQFGGNDDGVIDIISIGRCNHFGGGDPRVLRAVQNEDYGKYPPETHEHTGSSGSVDGNDGFYGIECYYSGSINMAQVLYNSVVRLWAAICDFHGWTAKSVIGHGEWSDWKWDPGRIDMAVLRADVQKLLDAGADGDPTPDGPRYLTPRITDAIRANIKYEQALEAITSPKLKNEIPLFIEELRAERKALKDKERIEDDE